MAKSMVINIMFNLYKLNYIEAKVNLISLMYINRVKIYIFVFSKQGLATLLLLMYLCFAVVKPISTSTQSLFSNRLARAFTYYYMKVGYTRCLCSLVKLVSVDATLRSHGSTSSHHTAISSLATSTVHYQHSGRCIPSLATLHHQLSRLIIYRHNFLLGWSCNSATPLTELPSYANLFTKTIMTF